jgi:hypothetical protein
MVSEYDSDWDIKRGVEKAVSQDWDDHSDCEFDLDYEFDSGFLPSSFINEISSPVESFSQRQHPVGCREEVVLNHKFLVSAPEKMGCLTTLKRLVGRPGSCGGELAIFDKVSGELLLETELLGSDQIVKAFDFSPWKGRELLRRVSFWYFFGRSKQKREWICERPWGESKTWKKAWKKKEMESEISKVFTQSELLEMEGMDEEAKSITEKFETNKSLGDKLLYAGEEGLAHDLYGCGKIFGTWRCKTADCEIDEVYQPIRCHLGRLCAFCSAARSNRHCERIEKAVNVNDVSIKHISALVLAVANIDVINKEVWRELHHRFTIFRYLLNGILGRVGFDGGCRTSEVTDSDNQDYHPHLHPLCQHEHPIPQSLISDIWLIATEGAGFYAWISRVKEIGAALRETVKAGGGIIHDSGLKKGLRKTSFYITKALEMSNPFRLAAAYRSMKGVRLFEMFGTWKNLNKNEEEEEEEEIEDDTEIVCRACIKPLEKTSGWTRFNGIDCVKKLLSWSKTFELSKSLKGSKRKPDQVDDSRAARPP